MESIADIKTIQEPAKETPVFEETEIVVVGAGPGGHSAAVAAARCGAKVVLIERYGHLGGMASGGLVTLIPHLSDGTSQQQIGGLCQEWLDRLSTRGGAVYPPREVLGSSDKDLVKYWHDFSMMCVREGKIRLSAEIDPELLKFVLNEMTEEAKVKLLCHSWGVQAISHNGRVQGVIFESKQGRQAVLSKIVIDATGDGDLLPSAGVDYDTNINPKLRIAKLALVFRLANIDIEKMSEFKSGHPEKHAELMQELLELGGLTHYYKTVPWGQVWFNNWIPDRNLFKVEDLTWVEVDVRKRMMITWEFFRKHVPGFEKSYISTTAPQLGTRGGRRLVGEYIITERDMKTGRLFKDTIATCPDLNHNYSPEHPHVHIPYRSMLPRKVDGFMVAGRCFSAEDVVQNDFNLIPHCIAIGQAVGTAAAMAVKQGVQPRAVNQEELRENLIKQGVPLPDIPGEE